MNCILCQTAGKKKLSWPRERNCLCPVTENQMETILFSPSSQGRCINFTRVKEESAAAKAQPRTPIHVPSPPPPDYRPTPRAASPPPTHSSPPARSPPANQLPMGPPPARTPPGLPCPPPSRPPPSLRPWVKQTNPSPPPLPPKLSRFGITDLTLSWAALSFWKVTVFAAKDTPAMLMSQSSALLPEWRSGVRSSHSKTCYQPSVAWWKIPKENWHETNWSSQIKSSWHAFPYTG